MKINLFVFASKLFKYIQHFNKQQIIFEIENYK